MAENNIRMMFSTEQKFGITYTEKEKQLMEDLRPGLYKIFTEQKNNLHYIKRR